MYKLSKYQNRLLSIQNHRAPKIIQYYTSLSCIVPFYDVLSSTYCLADQTHS